MSPRDADEAMILAMMKSKKLPHAGGVQAAMADASVHFLSTDASPAKLRAIITIAGNDNATANGQ
jgi:hypothetical protein